MATMHHWMTAYKYKVTGSGAKKFQEWFFVRVSQEIVVEIQEQLVEVGSRDKNVEYIPQFASPKIKGKSAWDGVSGRRP